MCRSERGIMSWQDQGADRYILDVRNNGGGSFPAGIQVIPALQSPNETIKCRVRCCCRADVLVDWHRLQPCSLCRVGP